MVEFNLKIKIINIEEGIKLAVSFPSLSYSREFFKYREKKYNLSGGFLAAYKNNNLFFLLPVNYSKDFFYSVYKDYTEPFTHEEFNGAVLAAVIENIQAEYSFRKIEFNFAFLKNNKFSLNLKNSELSIFVLKLNEKEDRDSLFKKFKKKTRNEIRKSEKFGFSIRINKAGSIDEMHKIYSSNMKRHGTPLKSKEYFEELFSNYKDKCYFISAYDKNKLAGMNIVFIKDNYLRLQYNYSDVKYWPHCVNNFLYYKMIEWGYKEGIRYFDFGPSLNTDISNIHFKLGYGARQVPIIKIKQSDRITAWKELFSQKRYNLKIRINKIKNKFK